MDAINQVLVEAGYFRALVSTITDFDKIVGGMAWAIQVFSNDVNIPILYTDSMDLGEKIALTEKIVMVLLVVNCPHTIEPHQIVGLDYPNLYPVIRWLMKRSAEVRKDFEEFNKWLALCYFYRVTNCLPPKGGLRHEITSELLHGLSDEKESTDSISPLAGHEMLDKLNERCRTNLQVPLARLPQLIGLQTQSSPGSGSTGEITQSTDTIKQQAKSFSLFSSYVEDDNEDTLASDDNKPSNMKAVDGDEQDVEIHLELLATNQKILNLLRKLDSMPSELETSQYHKRYIELHRQLNSKNKDLKKMYALYNTLDSVKYYLLKGVKLVDSINENIHLTENSIQNQIDFLRQLQDIISGMHGVRLNALTKLDSVRRRSGSLKMEYANLLGEQ